jgi:hypothetical protein
MCTETSIYKFRNLRCVVLLLEFNNSQEMRRVSTPGGLTLLGCVHQVYLCFEVCCLITDDVFMRCSCSLVVCFT